MSEFVFCGNSTCRVVLYLEVGRDFHAGTGQLMPIGTGCPVCDGNYIKRPKGGREE